MGLIIEYTCKDCKSFMGLGDWNLCCSEEHPEAPGGFLCYADTPACKLFKNKNDRDNKPE